MIAPRIVDATEAHLPGITEIYNDAVLGTTAIWNEQTVDVDDRARWLRTRLDAGYPVLVATEDDPLDGVPAVLGYATFGDWRAWDGYRHTVEHSVYVHPDHRGRGIGRVLMVDLIERARQLGKHVMVAAIESENVGSLRLHESLGFAPGGTLAHVGTKFGRWLDLTFVTLTLDEHPAPPA